MSSVRALRQVGQELLSQYHGDSNRALEAELLLRHVLGASEVEMFLTQADEVPADREQHFRELVARRITGEPIAYILGHKEFYGYRFMVNPAVLIPRPETELIVDLVLKRAKAGQGQLSIIDVGSGSGAIVLSCLRELGKIGGREVTGFGLDLSEAALGVSSTNAKNLGVENVTFIHSDLLGSLAVTDFVGQLIIVANPPYIALTEELPRDVKLFEPGVALWGGRDGLEVINRLIAEVSNWIERGADFLMEIGESQGNQIISAFNRRGFDAYLHKDLSGRDRVVEVRGGKH